MSSAPEAPSRAQINRQHTRAVKDVLERNGHWGAEVFTPKDSGGTRLTFVKGFGADRSLVVAGQIERGVRGVERVEIVTGGWIAVHWPDAC